MTLKQGYIAPDMVSISKENYDHLLKCESVLLALEAAGVDNWAGYNDAIEGL